jgi:acyl dehydratase
MQGPIHIPTIAALKDHIGRRMGPSDWVVVSQERIQAFAEATGDRQWIHTDPERARAESQFDGAIAHGYLTISLAPPLIDQLYVIDDCRMTVNYGIEKMRLQEAVPAGGRIRLFAEIAKVRMLPSGAARTTVHFVFEVEGGKKPACVCDAVLVYFP